MNHECVDCVAQRLPAIIKRSLESQLRSASTRPLSPDIISHVLSHAVVHLDESITSEFLELFPGGQRDLQRMNPGIIRQIVNDKGSGGHRHRKAAQVFGGSTALLALTDPSRQNLWVANLGDCHAGTCFTLYRSALRVEGQAQCSAQSTAREPGRVPCSTIYRTEEILRSSSVSKMSIPESLSV